MTVLGNLLVSVAVSVSALSGLLGTDPAPVATDGSTITVVIPGSSGPAGSHGPSAVTGTGTTAITVVPPARVAPTVAAGPTPGAPALPLSAETVRVAGILTATGTGYTPNEQVQFVLYSTPVVLASVAADATGTVALAFTIPALPTGQHVVEATGWESHRITNGKFLIVTDGEPGTAIFPMIMWVIVGAGLLLALITWLIAIRLGWIPRQDATPAAAAATQKVNA